ncbi:MAG: Lin0512 family protein [Bacillota bacterium]
MAIKRYIVELGNGADLHGGDVTKASCRAVKDAISRSCLCGIIEMFGVKDPNIMIINVRIGCPYPDQVDKAQVAAQIPFGTVNIEVVPGGLEADGLHLAVLGEGDKIVVSNVALTVSLDEKDLGLKG